MLSDKFVFNKIVQNGETGRKNENMKARQNSSNKTIQRRNLKQAYSLLVLFSRFKQNTVSTSEPVIATTHRVSFHHTDSELKSGKESQIKKPTKMGSDNGHTPIWNRSIT